MLIVEKRLTFPFKWLSTDIESASDSGQCTYRVMTIDQGRVISSRGLVMLEMSWKLSPMKAGNMVVGGRKRLGGIVCSCACLWPAMHGVVVSMTCRQYDSG